MGKEYFDAKAKQVINHLTADDRQIMEAHIKHEYDAGYAAGRKSNTMRGITRQVLIVCATISLIAAFIQFVRVADVKNKVASEYQYEVASLQQKLNRVETRCLDQITCMCMEDQQ